MSATVPSLGKAVYAAIGPLPDSKANGLRARGATTPRQHRWRARCVSKGARRVRRGASENPAGQPALGVERLLNVLLVQLSAALSWAIAPLV